MTSPSRGIGSFWWDRSLILGSREYGSDTSAGGLVNRRRNLPAGLPSGFLEHLQNFTGKTYRFCLAAY